MQGNKNRSNVQFLKESEKKITTRGLFISTLSHVKLIAETRHYICYKTWNLWVFFFYSFSKVFAEKYIKYIPQEMKNGLSLTKQKLQVILYYIITWAFISSLADKTNVPLKNKQYFHFSSPLKDTEIFPKLLFWTLNSSRVPQLISYYNLYIWWQYWSVQNREWPSQHKSNWWCLFTFKAC